MNNDQKESFFIIERNLESIDPNKDVTVSLKFEKSDYRNVGPFKGWNWGFMIFSIARNVDFGLLGYY